MSNVTSLGPRTLGAAVALPKSFLVAAQALGIPMPQWESEQKAFKFCRRKWNGRWGVVIFLRIGRLTLNITQSSDGSEMPAPFLPTRAEAVAWAIAFARHHGFEPLEDVRPKEPKPRPRPTLTVVPGGAP